MTQPIYQKINGSQFQHLIQGYVQKGAKEIKLEGYNFDDSVNFGNAGPPVKVQYIKCKMGGGDNKYNGANFTNSTFDECDFDGVKLRGATINFDLFRKVLEAGGDTSGCIFRGYSNLDSADFSDLKLKDIKFEHINFKQIQCYKTNFNNCIFEHVTIRNHTFLNQYFNHCRFVTCNLSGTKFLGIGIIETAFQKECEMKNVTFYNCDLTNTRFADDHGAPVKSLDPRSLLGTNLHGASLPYYLNLETAIKAESEASKNARNLFIILVPLCFYIFAAVIWGESAKDHITLPFMSLSFSDQNFLTVASLTIMTIFLYFHLYLQKIWDQIKYMPAIFPDGSPTWDRISPWMFGVLAWDHIPRLSRFLNGRNNYLAEYSMLRQGAPKNYGLQKFGCVFFGWIFPISLVCICFLRETIFFSGFCQLTWLVKTWLPLAVSTLVIILSGISFYRNIEKSLTTR